MLSKFAEAKPDMNKVAEFTAKILYGAANVHFLHLMAKNNSSYAHHMALNELYDEMPDLMDPIIEEFQGIYEVVTKYPPMCEYKNDPIAYVQELYDYVEANRMVFTNKSHLQSQIDLLSSAFARTLYKLKNLK